jgi:hypothetical protein
MASKDQGRAYLNDAAMSGEWTYSQGKTGDPALGSRSGDCVQYCMTAYGKSIKDKRSTSAIRGGDHPGFVEVDQASAQPGDMVVQGGHAGVLMGIDSRNGSVWAMSNNGRPSGHRRGYRDGDTTATIFNAVMPRKAQFSACWQNDEPSDCCTRSSRAPRAVGSCVSVRRFGCEPGARFAV